MQSGEQEVACPGFYFLLGQTTREDREENGERRTLPILLAARISEKWLSPRFLAMMLLSNMLYLNGDISSWNTSCTFRRICRKRDLFLDWLRNSWILNWITIKVIEKTWLFGVLLHCSFSLMTILACKSSTSTCLVQRKRKKCSISFPCACVCVAPIAFPEPELTLILLELLGSGNEGSRLVHV